MQYSDSHRTFLQMIMHAGVMSEYEIQQAAVKLFNFNNSASLHIAFVNRTLEPLTMAIKSARNELTGEKYYSFMSNTVDTATKFQTEFEQGQLELLRKIFTEIIHSPDGCVSSTFCLNLCTDLNHCLSKGAANEFLRDIICRKWLDMKDGQYYMGVRSIIELMPYFRSIQDEFNNCLLCKEIVFHGRRCDECQAVAHLYCLARFAKIGNTLKCTNCDSGLPSDGLPDVPDPTLEVDEDSETDSKLSQKRRKR